MARSFRESNDDLLVPADVLGAFGVTPADFGPDSSDGESLETALAETLSTGVDRRTVLRRTITRSDRGLACPARYSEADLEGELAAIFESIRWSVTISHTQDGLKLTATDPRGRRRETSVTYPETPLGTDNLPAVLWTINDGVLAGTGARFVLLSEGVDRWRAALIETSALERLRDRYGPRIEAVDRPLCPDHGLEAYVPDAAADDATGLDGDGSGADGDGLGADGDGPAAGDGPWPPWALERGTDQSHDPTTSVDSLIDEAEASARSEPDSGAASERVSSDVLSPHPSREASERSTASAPSSEIDGFELRGTPAVSRQEDDDKRSENCESETTVFDDGESTPSSDENATNADEFGTLSGTSKTARIDNDSFGTALDPQSDDDRYRALGAALDAGGAVSVRGLLEDDEFLPELPAVESEETRIEFADSCAPVDVPEAPATTERSGFEWVDSGSLETTRLSNQ
ncbi:hypothetical protein CP556_08455 [Natrinema sp. CBA1119]|uniref:hypothetical protein n=1 Tax=Natrinema sp. CBA1119 TaxID=1608465 RepID=UPI000BF5795E|nr:hypothetical protein [Natrinema sp. CBA1119]PGF16145.1 hypothetical protein CP556_08455 [Natrinema sp. CBA1119]